MPLALVVEAMRLNVGPLLTQTQARLTVVSPAALTVTFAEKNPRSEPWEAPAATSRVSAGWGGAPFRVDFTA